MAGITRINQTESDLAAGVVGASNITIPATTLGSLLLVIIAQAAASTAVLPTLSAAGATFVSPGLTATDGPPPVDFVAGNNSYAGMGYALNVPAGITTVTITWGATSKAASVNITEWTGVLSVAAVDAQKHGGGGVAALTQTATSLTTTKPNDLVVFALNSPGSSVTFASGTATPTTGWNVLTGGTNATSHMGAEYNIGAAGTYSGSWTIGSSAVAGMVGIAFIAVPPIPANYDITDDFAEV